MKHYSRCPRKAPALTPAEVDRRILAYLRQPPIEQDWEEAPPRWLTGRYDLWLRPDGTELTNVWPLPAEAKIPAGRVRCSLERLHAAGHLRKMRVSSRTRSAVAFVFDSDELRAERAAAAKREADATDAARKLANTLAALGAETKAVETWDQGALTLTAAGVAALRNLLAQVVGGAS